MTRAHYLLIAAMLTVAVALMLCMSSPRAQTDIPTLGPSCGLEWNPVDDARVEGYRLYFNGKMTKERKGPKWTSIKCTDAGAKPGLNTVYATAYGAGQESAPSNTVEFKFDPSELAGPSGLKWKIILEVSAE
jgi:hypothetical protein